MRVLILGGTTEGRLLAERLTRTPGVDVESSLAGRMADPRLPGAGAVRIGGFGDVDGLADHLTTEQIDAVVDATHPFAVRITRHAVAACRHLGLPLLALRRPGWTAGPGDDWRRVPDLPAAAAVAASSPPGAVLLTVGRRGAAAFADDTAHHYVIRAVAPPDAAGPMPPRRTIVLARGPFTPDGERGLFRERAITLLVTKDSGGEATAAKLTAARELGRPVVLIDRPSGPRDLPTAPDVATAESWIRARLTDH